MHKDCIQWREWLTPLMYLFICGGYDQHWQSIWNIVTNANQYYIPILLFCKVALDSNSIFSFNNSSLFLIKAFVRIFATIYCVRQYSSSTTLFSIYSLIKWCCTSICFDLSQFMGFLARAIEPWFLHMMVVAFFCIQPTSFISCLSQMASFVHRFIAMYSTSIVDCVTICCCLLFHDTAPSPTNKTYPKINLRFFTLPALSALE